MKRGQGDIADPENLPVRGLMNGEAGAGAGPVDDGGAGFLRQVEVAGDKISMKMCFEDIFYRSLPFTGQIGIGSRIPQRVDDCRFPFGFDIVGGLGQTACIQLFDKHDEGFSGSPTKLRKFRGGKVAACLIKQPMRLLTATSVSYRLSAK